MQRTFLVYRDIPSGGLVSHLQLYEVDSEKG